MAQTAATQSIHIQQKRHPTYHHSLTKTWKINEFNFSFKAVISPAMITR